MSVKTMLRVHFYDTDTMGVVHHANYIRWFETGRVEYLRSIGITLTEMMNDGILFPLTEVNAKFIRPAQFDEDLELETTAVELTKVKMEFKYKIRRQSDGELLVKGYSQNVFTNTATGKISRLPEKYFARMEKAMIEEMAQKNGDN